MELRKPKNYTVLDMYRSWLDLKMQEGIYKTEYDRIALKGIRRLIEVETGSVVMTYILFRNIIETFNKEVSQYLIEGQRFSLGYSLGYLEAQKHERNFKNPKVDIASTMVARRIDPTHPAIYYTNDHYCRIGWVKFHKVRNDCFYSFVPAKHSLRENFSRALTKNPLLKLNYKFFPLIKDKLKSA